MQEGKPPDEGAEQPGGAQRCAPREDAKGASPGTEGPALRRGALSPGPATGPQRSHMTGPSASLTLEPWDGLVFLGSEKAESGIVGNMG